MDDDMAVYVDNDVTTDVDVDFSVIGHLLIG
jgi:hypothetical protein